MRPEITPTRPRPELAALPIHLIVRDYPETLVVFRGFGIDSAGQGGGSIVAMVAADADAGALLDALADAIAWRDDLDDAIESGDG